MASPEGQENLNSHDIPERAQPRSALHSRSSSTSSASLDDSYEIVRSNTQEITANDLESQANGSLSGIPLNSNISLFLNHTPFHYLLFTAEKGDFSDAYPSSSSSDHEDDIHQFPDEDKGMTLSKRLAVLRNLKRQPLKIPTNFRILYVGSPLNMGIKEKIIHKFSDALSNIFWEAAEGKHGPNEIGLEKKYNLYPLDTFQDLKVDHYDDPGVSISIADYTNRQFEEVLEYLQKQFGRQENDDDLVDLCVFFIPSDVNLLNKNVIPCMKKLQGKVTLFPLISSLDDLNGQGIYFNNECEEKRKSLVKCIEDNGIEIFVWKEDGLVPDRDPKGEKTSNWVETLYTRKILAVEEFIDMDSSVIFEDLQLLRERSLLIRNDRKKEETAKKRAEWFERFVQTMRNVTITGFILGSIYLVIYIVWSYFEWSVIPTSFQDSLKVVSSASSRTQQDTFPSWHPIDSTGFEDANRVEVYQLSRSQFIIEALPKRRTDAYEVIVKHSPQVLKRYDSIDLGNGQYSVEIDATGVKGEMYVEVWEKYGELARVVKWSPNKIDQVAKFKADSAKPSEAGEKNFGDYAALAVHNINQWLQPTMLTVKVWANEVSRNIMAAVFYFGNQTVVMLKQEIDIWGPFIWAKIKEWAMYVKGHYNAGAQKLKVILEDWVA